MQLYKKLVFVIATLSLMSCASPSSKSSFANQNQSRSVANEDQGASDLPQLNAKVTLLPTTIADINKRVADPKSNTFIIERLKKYIAFLGIEPEDSAYKKVVPRLLSSSTQFILCPSFSDFECLEKYPELPIVDSKKQWRKETAQDLGKPVLINEPLKIKYFFTNQWDKPESEVEPKELMAKKLADIIARTSSKDKKWDAMSMAIYGMDDIEGSMKPIFDGIMSQITQGSDVRAVLDSEKLDKDSKDYPYVYTNVPYKSTKPTIFSLNSKNHTNLHFQYVNTPDLLAQINKGKTDATAKARIEWPSKGIMHNKFIVFKKGANYSLWTGTANLSRTCMGTERNTNLGVYIENTAIAEVFQTEFEEMYAYRKELHVDEKLVNRNGGQGLMVGSFNNDKRPNTKRYLKFKDGNEVRIHFSPTDDAEHRVILPMLLSARSGDQIRISMFGGGGYEYVRAFQYAVARGAHIRIVFDSTTGAGEESWLNNLEASLRDKNPYDPTPVGSIRVRMDSWNMNHHKSGTLTRKLNGQDHVEMIVFGSQNWSQSGNDGNDENVISIRNLQADVPIGKDFNTHFDERMWPGAEATEVDLGITAQQAKVDRQNKKIKPNPDEGAEEEAEEPADMEEPKPKKAPQKKI